MAAEVGKPDFSFQWASGGSIVAPSDVKIQTGWTAEVPPFQWENFLQNRQDNAILHLFQKGISEWDAASNYYFTTSGVRSYVQGSDGIVYVAVQDSIGQNPTTDSTNTYWKIAWIDQATLTTALNISSPIVGAVRNGRMSITTASATGTYSADEVVLATSLGGPHYKLPSFNKTINLGTVGLGGMDIGVAPVSGWVAVYAIYNPTTGVSGLLGKNATSALQTETYTGANAPAGFTASALVAILPTTAASLFAVSQLFDRHVSYFNNFFSGTVASIAAFTLTAIAGAVPINAKFFTPNVGHTPSGAGNNSAAIAPTAGGIGSPGYSTTAGYVGIAGAGVLAAQFAQVPIITAQTTYIAAGGTGSVAFNSYGYSF